MGKLKGERSGILHFFLILLLVVAGAIPQAGAQSRKELEDKRLKLIEDINRTNKKLQETQKIKAATLDRYLAIKAQVTKRQQLIATMRQEIAHADSAIIRNGEVMESLNDDIQRLRSEYARTLRAAYRHKLQHTWVAFIFSADNINQVFRRRQYLRQYDRYRRRQAALIEETQKTLAVKVLQLEQYKTEQQRLLEAAQQQGEILRSEMQDKDRALKELKTDETRLVAELERSEKQREQFSAAIEQIIRNEIAQQKKESRTPAGIASSSRPASAPAAASAAEQSVFGKLRGRLPWPVNGGSISKPFGPQPHPTLKGVTVPNNGVDIKAGAGAEVNAVFEGRVVGVQFVPGYQNTVIVQHGAYYTVYSRLTSLSVRKDEEIRAGQAIGKLGQDDLHFEVWREKTRLNPASWLK